MKLILYVVSSELPIRQRARTEIRIESPRVPWLRANCRATSDQWGPKTIKNIHV